MTVKAGGIIQTLGLSRIGVMSVPDRPGIASAVLSALGHERINVHFIVQSVDVNNRSHIILCVGEEDLDLALSVIDRSRPTVGYEQVIWQKNTAMVSLFGPHFRDYPGVAGLAFSALASAGINIWSISTSISTISCIIDEDRMAEAVGALQKVFEVAPSAVFTAACGLSLRSAVAGS